MRQSAYLGIACVTWSFLLSPALAQNSGSESREVASPAPGEKDKAPASQQPPAQTEDIAKALFATAKVEYEAGQYDRALQHFQEAYLESKRPQLLYNVGLAADRLRYNRTALEAFERYLKELPEAENRVEVQNRVRALRQVIEREDAAGKAPGNKLSATQSRPSPSAASHDGGLVSKWWFWTAVGVVVAGVATGIAVAASGDTVGKPVPGSGGVVVATLRLR